MDSINYSNVESSRFGANIFRYNNQDFNPKVLKSEIIKNDVDVLILRLPTNTKHTHSSLFKMGFPIIHADSLVYYFVGLNSLDVKPFKNELEFEIISSKNVNILQEIVPIIFDEYQNHYFSNPFFPSEKISEGYVEWALSYTKEEPGKISWLVKKDKKIAGFANCSFNIETKECEGILYGVMPNFSGQGIYSDIIRFTQAYFKEQGITKMWVSTQLQNYAVQKVWLREGFFLKKSFETYHINSMLNYSIAEIKTFDFSLNGKSIEEFAAFSGDLNPLHFNDNYAAELGFNERIAHGMIFQSYLSKYFGVDYPGNGTIYIENENLFFMPIYLNKGYKCLVNTISHSEKTGILKLLAKVIDSNNNLVLLSYNILVNKFVNNKEIREYTI